MSLHRSLKTQSGALNQHRNVLTRAERVAGMLDKERFDPSSDSPLGLVKFASRKVATKKKKKAEDGDSDGEAAAS